MRLQNKVTRCLRDESEAQKEDALGVTRGQCFICGGTPVSHGRFNINSRSADLFGVRPCK